MRMMFEKPKYLRTMAVGRPIGVDRTNNVLQGFVVAQLGAFKTPGRGQFDMEALQGIVNVGNSKPKGLRSNFAHADISNDGIGTHLGRVTDFGLSKAMDERAGKEVLAVRANLKFDPTALEESPKGGGKPYGQYVMDLAESDPGAISSSLVVTKADFFVKNDKEELEQISELELDNLPRGVTPIWRPTALSNADIVSVGDAVDGLLSNGVCFDGMTLVEMLFSASKMLDAVFAGQSRNVVRARCLAFLERYLDRTHGVEEPIETPKLDLRRKALWRMQERIESMVK